MTIRRQSFTLTDAAGAPCVQWQEMGETGFTLTVKGSQPSGRAPPVSTSTSPAPTARKFHNGNASDLFKLRRGLLGFPGELSGWSDTSVSQSLVGIEPSVPVFRLSG